MPCVDEHRGGGRERCSMPAFRLALSATIAACFATAVAPDATNAQSHGQGGSGAGTVTSPSPSPLATTPGTSTGAQTSPSSQTTATTPPSSAIGIPAQQQPPVAPLSPPVETTHAFRRRISQGRQVGYDLNVGHSHQFGGAEHPRRRGQDAAGLHGLLGQGDAHDEAAVAGRLPARPEPAREPKAVTGTGICRGQKLRHRFIAAFALRVVASSSRTRD